MSIVAQHTAPWSNPSLLNRPDATQEARDALRENILSILDFSHDWQSWCTAHTDVLPKKKSLLFYPQKHWYSGPNYLHWSLLNYLDQSSDLNQEEVMKVFNILIDLWQGQMREGNFPKVYWFPRRKKTTKVLATIDDISQYIIHMIPRYAHVLKDSHLLIHPK